MRLYRVKTDVRTSEQIHGSQPVPFGRTVAPGHWRHIAMTSHSSAPKPWFTSVWIAKADVNHMTFQTKKPTKITCKKGEMLKTNLTTPHLLEKLLDKTSFGEQLCWCCDGILRVGVVWGAARGLWKSIGWIVLYNKQYLRYVCQDSNQPTHPNQQFTVSFLAEAEAWSWRCL